MATGSDRVIGMGMVMVAGMIFTYYTLWVIVLPFVDADHVIQHYFLPRSYAITIPIVAGVTVLIGLGIFIFTVMLKNKKSKQKSN